MSDRDELPQRRHPAHGVRIQSLSPTIVFVTVCTKDRKPWLATPQVHEQLISVWKSATAWLAGRYVLMPDHIHLFAAPGHPQLPLYNWVKYWKSRFSIAHQNAEHEWQTDCWDRRLRSVDSYEEKWEYIRNNPVRHNLVKRPEDWPYQGELNHLKW